MFYLFASIILLCLLTGLANHEVRRFAEPYLSTNLNELPETKAALVLGTIPRLPNGQPNVYFQFRIQAAADLYQQGRVKYLIVSGDNNRRDSNEPDAMCEALVAHGVPIRAIVADYSGLRTLDSVVRARDIFGQNKIVIVSQPFHNERAVYLARHHGMEAYGYNAHDVQLSLGLKTRLREWGARMKMFWDLFTGTPPRCSGERVGLPD